MEPFTTLHGPAAALLLPNIDTDVITPMRRIVGGGGRAALARYAFEPLRYLEEDVPDSDFVLEQPAYRGAPILLAGPNFACGSSRETAVWALHELGFRCVVAPSFGDIFFKNCFQNGLLPIVLAQETVEALALEARAEGGHAPAFEVDLERTELGTPSGRRIPFEVHPARREALLGGLDDIGLSLRREAEIAAFQARDRRARPWVYALGDRGR
jgi:3-isopropylmalate/(R)-2-methylmalate dehydratase small subunit